MRTMYILLFAITSCTKFGKNVTVKGRVLNPVTGQGIAGAKIWLQREQFGFDGGYKTVKEAISDENGYYELDKLGLASYRATCQTGDRYDIGFTTDDGQSFTSNFWLTVKKGKTMRADYYTVPYGAIKINVKNVNCFDQNDLLQLYLDYEEFDVYTFNHGLSTQLTGCIDIPGDPVRSVSGNKIFHWVVTKNGVVTTYYDTVFVPENATAILNVYY